MMSSEGSHADPDADAHLVAAAKEGDLDSFGVLVNRHSLRLFRTVVAVTRDPDEARDAMQDTLLKVIENIGSFRGDSSFSTWLTSIAVNTATQRLREKKRMRVFAAADGNRMSSEHAPNPEQLYLKAEKCELLRKGLIKVPRKYREVLMLRDIEQLSTGETAATLGLQIPATKARLSRARIMLREALDKLY